MSIIDPRLMGPPARPPELDDITLLDAAKFARDVFLMMRQPVCDYPELSYAMQFLILAIEGEERDRSAHELKQNNEIRR